MTNFTYLLMSDDLVADANSVTPDDEDSNFPFSNVRYDVDGSIANPGRTNAATTSLDLLIDTGASYDWNLVALLNHNLSESATVTLKAGTTSATSDLSQSITWREFDMHYLETVTRTYRYVRLVISDASNGDGYIQLGGVRIGLATELSRSPQYGVEVTYNAGNRVLDSDLFVTRVDRLADRVEVRVSWGNMSASERDQIIVFVKSLQGGAIPLYIIIDPSIYEGFYVRGMSNAIDTRTFVPSVGAVLFREESRGAKLAA